MKMKRFKVIIIKWFVEQNPLAVKKKNKTVCYQKRQCVSSTQLCSICIDPVLQRRFLALLSNT